MDKVKAALMNEAGEITVKDIERPTLENGAVLIKTLYSEVCGTDVHLSHNKLSGVPYPIIPGHVSTGLVEEVNGEVTDVEGDLIKPGDAVTFLDVNETCNSCWFCLVAKESTRCPKRKVYGITYSANDGLLGGWSNYIYLKPGVKIIKLTSPKFAKTFIAAGCGLPTAIHAVERANIHLGDTVVVQGSGPVGLMSAIIAKRSGAFKVIVIGGPSLRLDIVRQFGIEDTISIDEYSPEERIKLVKNLTNNRGADKIIEATGVAQAVKEGFGLVRDGGTYVIVGQYTNSGEIAINPHLDINKKHLTVRGSWGSDFSHFYLAVKFVEAYHSKYPWEKIISQEYNLEETRKALTDVENYIVMKAIIKP